MNKYSLETMNEALEILKVLLQGEEISKSKNVLLFEKYRYNTEIEEMLHHIAGKLEIRVYLGQDKLFTCPEAGSRLFGWTNEELRSRISYVSRNEELFLCYFIIMVLITMFYREAYPDTPVAYVKISDLIENVRKRFDTLVKLDNLEKISVDNNFNFVEVARVWRGLADAREGVSSGKNDKINFVENVCRFLEGEKLIIFDKERRLIFPDDRFKTIIWHYYEERDNRSDLLSFVSGLED